MGATTAAGAAWFAGMLAEGVVESSADPGVLDRGGWWAVVATFEGELALWRFDRVRRAPLPSATPWSRPGIASGDRPGIASGDRPGTAPSGRPGAESGSWPGIDPGSWTSSLDRDDYVDGVSQIRRRIREGEVYQVNLCRVLSAPVPPDADPWALATRLAAGNPAPYAGVVHVPGHPGRPGHAARPGTTVVTASPELFLAREGDVVRSGPIKGTAPTPAGLLPKDEAENVMIVDLVRNDLQRVCRAGSVAVPALLALEHHPGLVHLVSTVEGRLTPGAGWADLLAATMPPGSVSGAPKSSALRAITDLEPVPRGPYCGAVGWVDADRGRACLAVGIRSFWCDDGLLKFGTGAGITWGSDPVGEWDETVLKARRLIGLTAAPDLGAGAGPGVRADAGGGDGRVGVARAGAGPVRREEG